MFGVLEAVIPGDGSDCSSDDFNAVEEAEEEDTERANKDTIPFTRGEPLAIAAIAPPQSTKPSKQHKNSPTNCKTLQQF